MLSALLEATQAASQVPYRSIVPWRRGLLTVCRKRGLFATDEVAPPSRTAVPSAVLMLAQLSAVAHVRELAVAPRALEEEGGACESAGSPRAGAERGNESAIEVALRTQFPCLGDLDREARLEGKVGLFDPFHLFGEELLDSRAA